MIKVMKSNQNAKTHMYVHITQTQIPNRHQYIYWQTRRQTDTQTDVHVMLLTLLIASSLAPLSSKSLTTSKWPFPAALCRAVLPSWYQYDYWIIINIVTQSTALCVTSHIVIFYDDICVLICDVIPLCLDEYDIL